MSASPPSISPSSVEASPRARASASGTVGAMSLLTNSSVGSARQSHTPATGTRPGTSGLATTTAVAAAPLAAIVSGPVASRSRRSPRTSAGPVTGEPVVEVFDRGEPGLPRVGGRAPQRCAARGRRAAPRRRPAGRSPRPARSDRVRRAGRRLRPARGCPARRWRRSEGPRHGLEHGEGPPLLVARQHEGVGPPVPGREGGTSPRPHDPEIGETAFGDRVLELRAALTVAHDGQDRGLGRAAEGLDQAVGCSSGPRSGRRRAASACHRRGR